MAAGLSFAAAPPPSVPLRFFLSAPLFGLFAALALLLAGPAALTSRWHPYTLAITHLLVLGVLMTVMLGALFQMLPVLLGTPVSQVRRIAGPIHAGLVLGTLALAGGLAFDWLPALHLAVPLLAFAVGGFVVAALFGVARPPHTGDGAAALYWAGAALLATAALGLWLAAGHAWPDTVALRRDWTDVHALWGLAGWVGLLVTAVAFQVVPMFAVSASYPAALRCGLAPALFAVLAAASAGPLVPLPYALRLGLVAAGVGLLASFALVTARLIARRRRRLPDPWLGYWRLALGALLAAAGGLLAGYLAPWLWAEPRFELALGVTLLAGFALTLVVGMLQKIVPFLIWLDISTRLRERVRGQAPPNVRELLPQARIRRHLWLHTAALAGLLAAVAAPALVRPAALLLAADFVVLAVNLGGTVALHRRGCATIRALPPAGGPRR